MDHTVLHLWFYVCIYVYLYINIHYIHHACLSFVRVHQMAALLTEVADIQLHLTTHLYRPRRDEKLSWPSWLSYSGRFTHWSPVSYRSSAGQGKFAGQRPTLYHCATQPTSQSS